MKGRKILRYLNGSLLLLCLLCAGVAFAADKIYFYHTDPAGTPIAMSDDTGAIVWKATYKPFGEEQAVTGSIVNDKKFIGKEKDEETGLSYFGARYMKNEIGRFLSPDPVGPVDPKNGKINQAMLTNPQRLNPYAYALNNPYRYVDPDGRDIWDIGFFAYSGYNFAKEPSWENAGYLGLDAIGLIPVVPALGTIARVAKGAEKAIGTANIAAKIAKGHAFEKHLMKGKEFEEFGIRSQQQFADFVGGIMKNASGADVKQLNRGRTAYWDTKTGTAVIHDPMHVDAGTAFRPAAGRQYFDKLE